MAFYTCPGCIHIHSTYSDGSGTVAEIAAAAASAGLRYIIITDHSTLQAFHNEGFLGGVAVLGGVEFHDQCCHYLAMGLSEMVHASDEEPQQVIDAVAAAGALGFIAHPFEKGSPYIEGGVAFPWTDWPVFGFTGMEIWNYSSHWRGRAVSIPRVLYWFLLNRKAAMDGPPQDALKLWDCYTAAGRKVVAIGGTDAHAARRRVAFIPVEIFPYRFLFRTIKTYLCLPEPLNADFFRARAQIYTALAGGRCFLSFDQLHPGNRFSFTATSPHQESTPATMGDSVGFERAIRLNALSPSSRSLIRLIHNGRLILQQKGSSLTFQPQEAGVYRIEVYYRSLSGAFRPWIYSNPIYLQSMK